jgi:hypothetical protein
MRNAASCTHPLQLNVLPVAACNSFLAILFYDKGFEGNVF